MREPQDFSPWWLTAPFCLTDRLWLSGQKGNARCVRSDSLRSLLSHFPCQLKPGKIRNARCVRSDSLRSLLSHFPCQLKPGKIRNAHCVRSKHRRSQRKEFFLLKYPRLMVEFYSDFSQKPTHEPKDFGFG